MPRQPSTTPLHRLHVAKTYSPAQDGAKRLALRHGHTLVCVRHRLSEDGSVRHTTVELLVESTPVVCRQRNLVALSLPQANKAQRAQLLDCGAKWDAQHRLWLIPHMVAKSLRLLKHRVPRPTDPTNDG